MNQAVIERAHARIGQPHLAGSGGVDRVWNPGERVRNGTGVLLLREQLTDEAIKLVVANDVQRCGRDVMALLIAGRHKAGLRMNSEKWLAQAVCNLGYLRAIRRDAEHGAVLFSGGGALLAALGEKKRTIRRKLHSIGVFSRLGSLGEIVAEEFVAICFAISIDVAQTPDAISIEDKDFFIANRKAQGLVQTAGKAFPAHFLQILFQPGNEPHI